MRKYMNSFQDIGCCFYFLRSVSFFALLVKTTCIVIINKYTIYMFIDNTNGQSTIWYLYIYIENFFKRTIYWPEISIYA